MSHNLNLPATLTKLHTMVDQPYNLGKAVGVLLYNITPLLSTHLDNAVEFRNKVPEALKWTPDFVVTMDQYVAYLRLADGCSERFIQSTETDRQGRQIRKKYMQRYTNVVEAVYKDCIREHLKVAFQSWTDEQTQLFNKGIDKALSGTQWVVYPKKNVVTEAAAEDWAAWIRQQCELLGMGEVRAGRRALEDI
ncbi:hypothetical protein BKA66DRAFT_475515 [Pyrenochaeta sp. MPI-SDFR-AT-0127]|nr:hypothetical protein BKA66DRAFT_475515 [Pyrenochaeta sp. MPI-SDFR-AT-0127]